MTTLDFSFSPVTEDCHGWTSVSWPYSPITLMQLHMSSCHLHHFWEHTLTDWLTSRTGIAGRAWPGNGNKCGFMLPFCLPCLDCRMGLSSYWGLPVVSSKGKNLRSYRGTCQLLLLVMFAKASQGLYGDLAWCPCRVGSSSALVEEFGHLAVMHRDHVGARLCDRTPVFTRTLLLSVQNHLFHHWSTFASVPFHLVAV